MIKTFVSAALMVVTTAVASASLTAPVEARSYKPVAPHCLDENEAVALLKMNLKSLGYLDTFAYRKYDNDTKVQAFGVKANDQWYSFAADLCSGHLIGEDLLKYGKPGFI